MWRQYNPNPTGGRVGDCTVRALSAALNQEWMVTYIGLCLEGLILGDMPSANRTWGSYLSKHGFKRHMTEKDETVRDFAASHPTGVYVLAISGHVVCLRDGDWWDSFDSCDEVLVYYWQAEEPEKKEQPVTEEA